MNVPHLRVPDPVERGGSALDPFQAEAVAQVSGGPGHVVVVGEPGAGKTTVAVAALRALVDQGVPPARLLLLTPMRAGAAVLRDRVSVAVNKPSGAPLVRTPASLAHAILTRHAHATDMPPPGLITGAEQDSMLRELLAGHARGEGRVPDWQGIVPPEATALPGFRSELRDVLMRAAEAGLLPEDLAELGQQTGRPEWVACAQVMHEYLDANALRTLPADQGERHDPASVAAQAAWVIDTWEESGAGEAPAWDVILVDDAHELTAAAIDLLRALAARGARVVLLGNADESVQGYRGAVPAFLSRATAAQPDGLGAVLCELGPSHRQSGGLAAVTRAVTSRIGVLGEGSARVRPGDVDPPDPSHVSVVVARHRYGQSRAIAAALRKARHGLDGAPLEWSRMAVIARSTTALRALRSDLAAADIPCESLGDGVALHQEPAVAPLIALARIATGEREWDDDSAAAVLGSRIGGVDPVALRRIRRALMREERAGDGRRTSSELLVDAMENAQRWATVDVPQAVNAQAVVEAVELGRRAIAEGGAPGRVLWVMWERLGLAARWRAGALAGSARDDADLDAVIALFRAAQTFTERLPSASVSAFVDHLEGQEFAADSLGATATEADVVAFATPASAAGREWDLVVVAGLEEGLWPNLTPRDSVLGAQHLADVVAGRAAREPMTRDSRAAAAAAARANVLDDETRAFAVAVSRARTSLILSAVEGDEERPSRFLAWVEAAAGVSREIASTPASDIADLRSAVTALRVRADAASGEARERYARMLAQLADRGVQGASPASWHGVPEQTTEEGFWNADEPVRVSPSKVDSVETCALRWALESAGGVASSTGKQLIGTLVHEIAAEHPHGSHEELATALEERWHELGYGDGWPDRMQRVRADGMIRRLAQYFAMHADSSVQVEARFSVPVGRAVLAGSADRVETTPEGTVIVDLKTGKEISAAAAVDHGQLSMYQVAAAHGAFPGVERAADASLVFIGTSQVKAAERPQGPVDLDDQRERLERVVDRMAASTFDAVLNDACDHCPVRRSCPAQSAGDQVSDT